MQDVFLCSDAVLLAELDTWHMVPDAGAAVLSGRVWNGGNRVFPVDEVRKLYCDAVKSIAAGDRYGDAQYQAD